ncbi:hypothetical protein CCR96_02870 [Halochromatium roseum]|nr:hypothetical protein [Halochromatium roseum]
MAPLPSLALHLTAWAVFILVLILSALLDRQREQRTTRSTMQQGVRSERLAKRPLAFGMTPVAEDQDIDDWLGPFNPDNGLSLDIAPYFIHDDLGRDS